MPNKLYVTALNTALARIPDGGYTGEIHAEVKRLSLGSEALIALYSTPDPQLAPEEHRRRVADSGKNFQNEVVSARYRIQSNAKTALDKIAGRIAEKVRLIPDHSAPAVRTKFRNLNTLDQEKLLGDLVDGNRASELAALTECPALMSGLTAELQTKFRKAFIARHAPSELDDRSIVLDALNNAVTAADVAAKIAKYAARGPAMPRR